MEIETTTNILQELGERIAVLETKWERLDSIEQKLDELLHLKSQGMGALWLVSLIIGSGVFGLVAAVISVVQNRAHL